MSRLPKVTVPVMTGSLPVTALSKVDLPAPFGPITETTSPGPTLMLASETIAAAPYPAATSWRCRTGGGRPASPGGWCPAGLSGRRGGWPGAPGGGLSDEVGIQYLPVGAYLGHGSLGDHPPLGHHDDRVAQPFHHGKLVLDHEHGEPFTVQVEQVLLDPPGQGRVHPRHRLIEQQECRGGHQPAHQLQQAFLAAAEGSGVLVFLGGHVEACQQLARPLHHCPLLRPPVALAERGLPQRLPPLAGSCDQQVLQHGQPGELTRDLEGADDPAPGHLVCGEPGDVLALVGDLPGGRFECAGDDVEDGRLPGAVRPDQPGDPAEGNLEGRAVDRIDAAELAVQVGDRERGAGGLAHRAALVDVSGCSPSPSAAGGKRRRRSGMTPRGQNHKKTRASTPTMIHCRASMNPGGPNCGMKRVASRKATGTSRAPTMTPRLFPNPPTMTAVKYTNVSGYSQDPGDQAEMNSTRMAPMISAITPPSTNAIIRSPVTFLPRAAAARSLSRTARSVRPSGELVTMWTSQ